ncbi:helicase-exonuclease AddAB subunit AddA [Lactobacillus sp. S2-2]|uniref:helicase-exonuclease AddAB subunit AddA n=1 Tax=Lactobacillus sp. S2-2 TaxID=2692917 RepID=UPI001F017D19|nr:helicase-exonuclease AddAB subunit AddA [Lactobacillus sp. S2-2]MCF6515412.1 helicase-exonuclease AddAB subunit AddA [Lactobacillus sp. S2-2]
MEYTKEQHQAVYGEFDGDVLVSASAGSGKTRVLVDRVVNKLINGVSIDNLIIVTFTKAAAKEMRDRIQQALREKINEESDFELQKHLLNQIRKLPIANISTLDAFCQKVVQNNYFTIDLDPNFRILTDQTEQLMLREQVWDDLRESLYANDENNEFAELTENFSNDRSDDGLTETIMKIYDFAQVNQNPTEWLDNLPDFYDVGDDLSASDVYQKYLLKIVQDELITFQKEINDSLEIAKMNNLVNQIDDIQKKANVIDELLNSLSTFDYSQLKEKLDYLNSIKLNRREAKYSDEEKAARKIAHNQQKDASDAFKDAVYAKFFLNSEAENQQISQKALKLVRQLSEIVKQFSDAYLAKKKQLHAFEFIDIEHFAFDILAGDAPQSINVRENYQNRINEILIDEYQDNNRLQDAILSTIKNPNHPNMFMVGDVKQSIYQFRLADPSMFIDKMENYQNDNDNQLITLADNFRSEKNIDDFTNLIFSQIMDKELGEINYTGKANLQFGATYYPSEAKRQTEIMLYETDDKNDQIENERLEIQDGAHGQVEMISQKIRHLIDDETMIYDREQKIMRPILFSDISILSATRNNNLVIADVFEKYQIPVDINGSQSYFKTTEMQIMMALLSIIDNPYQDIPLAAVLRSPMIGMNENQMAYLRINHKTGDYFEALLDFYHNYEQMNQTEFSEQVFQKVKTFIEQLDHFKEYAKQHELAELIWEIYDRTGFLDYVGAMPAGEKRQANLHALYNRATEYENSSFKGLFAFIRFVEKLQANDDDLAQAESDTDDNSVKVMTIHGSKGLEFPVVFLMDATHQFNKSDTRSKYLLDDQLGLGIKYLNQTTRVQNETLQDLIIKNKKTDAMLAEQMRQLYVALTRTEQYLIITGTLKHKTQEKVLEEWQKDAKTDALLLDKSNRKKANSFIDWIGPALVRHPNFIETYGENSDVGQLGDNPARFNLSFISAKELQDYQNQPVSVNNNEWLTELEQKLKDNTVVSDSLVDQVFDHQYEYLAATNTTAYQSVSEIKGLFDDPDIIQLGSATEIQAPKKQKNRYLNSNFATPKFMQSVSEASATDVGTALHLMMQQIDVTETINLDYLNHLLNDLVKKRLISEKVSAKINLESIVKFYQSDLGKRILSNSDCLKREVPFSLVIDANQIFSEFDNSDEQILIHGIIDGYLEFEDQVVLFDYKTDFINPKQLSIGIDNLKDKYRGQLNIYALALQEITKKPVNERYLYSLSADQAISINAQQKE